MTKLWSIVAALMVVAVLTPSARAVVKPLTPLKNMHPVDACLFICNMCYKGDMLMFCVNQGCLKELATGQKISGFFSSECPGLENLKIGKK